MDDATVLVGYDLYGQVIGRAEKQPAGYWLIAMPRLHGKVMLQAEEGVRRYLDVGGAVRVEAEDA